MKKILSLIIGIFLVMNFASAQSIISYEMRGDCSVKVSESQIHSSKLMSSEDCMHNIRTYSMPESIVPENRVSKVTTKYVEKSYEKEVETVPGVRFTERIDKVECVGYCEGKSFNIENVEPKKSWTQRIINFVAGYIN